MADEAHVELLPYSQSLAPKRHDDSTMPLFVSDSSTENLTPDEALINKRRSHRIHFNADKPSLKLDRYVIFFGLIITTAVSSVLLVNDRHSWILSTSLYHIIDQNRASSQIVVQLLANIFGLVQVTALCTLINRSTRLYFARREASLDTLRWWFDLCTPQTDWSLPSRYLIPLLVFKAVTVLPTALWAGSISPINVSSSISSTVVLPSYTNTSLIHEYGSEADRMGPLVRTAQGIFSYSPMNILGGSLLSSAATATPPDGTIRQHGKLDSSGFTYNGRSYGIGSSAGIKDGGILEDSLATNYAYQEIGYNAIVNCIYNSSSDFTLGPDPNIKLLWVATGLLPNSVNGTAEYSTYVGYDSKQIVAIGVAATQSPGIKYIAVAAGEFYQDLNSSQCTIDYIPTLFNVSIGIRSRNITVVPVSSAKDMNPTGNIRHVTTRQLELFSNDQTNLYYSQVGSAFAASIGDYFISQSNSSNTSLSEANSTLAGLSNSVTAMVDDVLVAYASAQLMVGNFSSPVNAVVTRDAMKIGQGTYIYGLVAFNTVVILLVIVEAIRTSNWSDLPKFDYMDIKSLIINSSRGGTGIAQAVEVGQVDLKQQRPFRYWRRQETSDAYATIGRVKVNLDNSLDALILAK